MRRQWDGKYQVIGDDEAYKIYRFTVSGSSGTLEDTVTLGASGHEYSADSPPVLFGAIVKPASASTLQC
jgi:hypothetical protein